MSAESFSEQDRELARKLTSSPIFFDPNFEKWVVDRVMLNIGNMPLGQMGGARGVERHLYAESPDTSAVNTSATVVLFSGKIKGKTIAKNGSLRVFASGTAQTTDASNQVTFELKLGGNRLFRFPLTDVHMDGNANTWAIEAKVVNTGEYNLQRGLMLGEYKGSTDRTLNDVFPIAGITSPVDTSVDQDLVVAASWLSGNAASIFTLKYVSVSVFNPIGLE